MIADVTLVAEDHVGLVVLLAAALAHRAVQAPPPLLQDHLGHLTEEEEFFVYSLQSCGADSHLFGPVQRSQIRYLPHFNKLHIFAL